MMNFNRNNKKRNITLLVILSLFLVGYFVYLIFGPDERNISGSVSRVTIGEVDNFNGYQYKVNQALYDKDKGRAEVDFYYYPNISNFETEFNKTEWDYFYANDPQNPIRKDGLVKFFVDTKEIKTSDGVEIVIDVRFQVDLENNSLKDRLGIVAKNTKYIKQWNEDTEEDEWVESNHDYIGLKYDKFEKESFDRVEITYFTESARKYLDQLSKAANGEYVADDESNGYEDLDDDEQTKLYEADLNGTKTEIRILEEELKEYKKNPKGNEAIIEKKEKELEEKKAYLQEIEDEQK